MGMYTEMIFGGSLSKDTPRICIEALDRAINDEWDGQKYVKKPKYENPQDYKERAFNENYIERTIPEQELDDFADRYDFNRLFFSTSYYFGAHESTRVFNYDPISKSYVLSTRANCKNYSDQIERWIEYITPYVESGSGYPHGIFAIVQYEESEFPTLYGIDGEYHFMDPEFKEAYAKKNEDWYSRLRMIFEKLAPEYAITAAEKESRGFGVDYMPSYKETWDWMLDYILNKFIGNVAPKHITEEALILQKAIDTVFERHYCKDSNLTHEELERYREIQTEFNKLINNDSGN